MNKSILKRFIIIQMILQYNYENDRLFRATVLFTLYTLTHVVSSSIKQTAKFAKIAYAISNCLYSKVSYPELNT